VARHCHRSQLDRDGSPDSYHGWSDGTMARPLNLNGQIRSLPAAPGVNPGALEDVMVLEYGSPQSLEILKMHAHELAGGAGGTCAKPPSRSST